MGLKFEFSDGTGIGGGAIFLWYGADGEGEFIAFQFNGAVFLAPEKVSEEGVVKSIGATILSGNYEVQLYVWFKDEGACGDGLEGGF